jgi:hypothetical protein
MSTTSSPTGRSVLIALLDDVTLYWLTNTATSAAGLYWGRDAPISPHYLDYAARLRIHNNRTTIHHCIAILRNLVFSRYLIIGHALRRQFSADDEIRTIGVRRPIHLSDIGLEAGHILHTEASLAFGIGRGEKRQRATQRACDQDFISILHETLQTPPMAALMDIGAVS